MLNKGYFNSIYDYITITIISDISNSLNRNVENMCGNMEIYIYSVGFPISIPLRAIARNCA